MMMMMMMSVERVLLGLIGEWVGGWRPPRVRRISAGSSGGFEFLYLLFTKMVENATHEMNSTQINRP